MNNRIPSLGTLRRYGAGALAILALAGSWLHAQTLTGGSFVLVGTTGAGGLSSGEAYVLAGYVAGAGASASRGGEYVLTCGFLGAYETADGSVALNAELNPEGLVRLWWTALQSGYQLEFSNSLGSEAHWQTVDPAPMGNEYITLPQQPARFFRLRRP